MALIDRLPHKQIGWKEIGEDFIRYAILKTPWFNVYLHRLIAPAWHPMCHDHPWSFVTFILWSGYLERVASGKEIRRRPGSVLYRPAEFRHNVITPYGTAWSLIVTTKKSRDWGFQPCEGELI